MEGRMSKTPRAKVLLVPIRPAVAALGTFLSDAGYGVTVASDAAEAAAYTASPHYQAVILDLGKPTGMVMPLMESALQSPSAPAVLCCGQDITAEMAVMLMRAGASDCFIGPLNEQAVL